jgi:penicillin-insensitive murein endopeptidase
MFIRRSASSLALLLALALTLPSSEAASPPGPLFTPLRIIGGGAAGGCFTGGERLPGSGPGFETIHRDRSSFWGAPQTIVGVELLGREAQAAGLPTLLVEDISNPHGGPMSVHAAHQVGLDADIATDMRPRPPLDAAERQSIVLASLVLPDQRGVEPGVWSPAVITLLHLAATLPDVDRVLVNPAIKRQLCLQVTGDRSWLRFIRPWYGHAAHMHVHFRCPVGQTECVQIPPPPPGDGCDATLQWWFDRLNVPPVPAKPHKRPPLPAACRAILAEPVVVPARAP